MDSSLNPTRAMNSPIVVRHTALRALIFRRAFNIAAWNAAIYVAQIDDLRLSEAVRDTRYLDATREVLQKHGSLWFLDESYVVGYGLGSPDVGRNLPYVATSNQVVEGTGLQ